MTLHAPPAGRGGGVAVHHGNCLDVLPSVADASVDAVIIDPPFFMPAQHYSARREWPRSLSDLSIMEHFYKAVFKELRRVLKRPGHLLCFCNAQSYPVFYVSAYRLFHNSACLVWDKGQIGLGGGSWRNQHELVLACYDSGAKVDGHAGTVLRQPPVQSANRSHPAEKPLPLLRALIKATCPSGGVVLDCFAGSGSLGRAAEAEGRRAILIEGEETHVEHMRGEDMPMFAGEAA